MIGKQSWWQRLPLLRALLLLVLGIIGERMLDDKGYNIPLLLLALAVLIQVVLWSYQRYRRIGYAWEFLKSGGMLFFLLGSAWLYAHLRNPRAQATSIANYEIRKTVLIEAFIRGIKIRPGKSSRLTLECEKVHGRAVEGTLWFYCRDSSLTPGMKISTCGTIVNFAKQTNLLEWQQGAYERGVDGIVAVARGAPQLKILEAPSWQTSLLYRSQDFVNRIFHEHLPDSIAGFATALCIGEKDGVSKTVQRDYTACGLSHILAVSGMHLGLVVLALQRLLFFLKKRVRMQTIILILFIWLFALLSGASAAVLRAALMYSISLAAPLFYRKAKAENGIVASLFILLLIEPNYFFDVGFQLSYAAICSILWLYPILRSCLFVSNKFLLALWDLVCISIAAQLLTAPLCLYYFKQFPNYFLLANLWAIPLSTIVLYALLFLLPLHAFPTLCNYWGILCFYLVKWLNLVIHRIAYLPGACSFYPNFHMPNAIAFMVGVYCLTRLYQKQNAVRIIQTALAFAGIFL